MRTLHHIALGTQAPERLAAFYCDLLELSEVARHHWEGGDLRSIWLAMGDVLLMIEETKEPPRAVTGIGAGPFLLAFRATPKERAEVEARLEAAGTPIEMRSPHSSYFRDPDGNRLAISHHPEAPLPASLDRS